MVGDTRLSQPRDHGGDMVVKTVYSVRIVGSITLRLLDIVFLRAEEFVFCLCLTDGNTPSALTSYLEVSLPSGSFKDPLASMMLCPDLVRCVALFRSRITSTLLSVHLLMFLFTVFLHSV
jgi:hypothetical protein